MQGTAAIDWTYLASVEWPEDQLHIAITCWPLPTDEIPSVARKLALESPAWAAGPDAVNRAAAELDRAIHHCLTHLN